MPNNTKKILAISILGIFAALTATFFVRNWSFTNPTPYQAPLYKHDHPGRVPGYIVSLRPGHSLIAHDAALAIPVNTSTRKVVKIITDYVLYYIEVDDETLDAIRADPGVEQIECNVSQIGVRRGDGYGADWI